MIDFVLPDAGGEVVGRHLVQAAFEIIRPHDRGLGAPHLLVEFGETEATLAGFLDAVLLLDEDGIDGDALLIALQGVAGEVHDQEPIGQGDLRRGEAESLGGIHGSSISPAARRMSLSGGEQLRDVSQAGCGY